jgi:4-amino-4-deoxy-L-arabinose transferase-like glycosyltransferase
VVEAGEGRARPSRRRAWPPLAGLVLLVAAAFALRLAYLAEISGSPFFRVLVGDSVVYDAWADEIRADVVGKDVFYQAPLYPYFLAAVYALFGHGAFVARVVQAALGAAACGLVASAGGRLFGRRVGLAAGALLALSGPCLFFGGLVHKAALDLFLMSALLYTLARLLEDGRARWALATGAVLGALTLTRENALILFPLLGAALAGALAIGRRAHAIGLFVLGGALVLAPVALRNYAVGGELVLTTSQFGANFYLGNNAEADGTYTPLRFGHGDVASEHADAIELAEQASGRKLTAGEVSHYWSSRAFAWMREHPGDWARLLAHKWRLVWSAHEISDSDEILVYEDTSALLRALATLFGFGTFAALAAVGMAATWSERRRVGVLYVIVGGLAAATALFFVFGRYRVALYPPLALFAAAGVARVVALARSRPRPRALGATLAVGVAAAVLAALPIGGNPDGVRRGTAHYNIAVTQEARGDLEAAVASYRASLAFDPTAVQAHINLGALLARGGAFDEAIAEEHAALRLRPDDVFAHVDLANALLESGRLDEAEPHYREALRLDPEQPQARQGLLALQDLRAHPR